MIPIEEATILNRAVGRTITGWAWEVNPDDWHSDNPIILTLDDGSELAFHCDGWHDSGTLWPTYKEPTT